MNLVIKLITFILLGIPQAIFNPFFWFVLVIVYIQYKRAADFEEKMFGFVTTNPIKRVSSSLLYGIFGGFLGSVIVVALGVSIAGSGLSYVWPLALLLMLISPHLMCFSYAGGIISVISLLFGVPKVDVAGLMALVGVLHAVESLLIYLSGHLNASPVFIKDEKRGIIGGYLMQSFWPVPFILLTIATGIPSGVDAVNMPDWWPIIRPPFVDLENALYLMLPVVAALGYGDFALTRLPGKKGRESAFNLLIFSTLLILLSVLASRINFFKYIAALFAPVGHEYLINIGKTKEKKGDPLFTVPPFGMRILYVLENSPAEKMGLKPGDIILSINNKAVNSIEDLKEIKALAPAYLWMEYLNTKNEVKYSEMSFYPYGFENLGVVLIPRGEEVPAISLEESSLIKKIKNLFSKKPSS
ncbi:PDZ domain-containing protein [Thermovenabulum gondwanense]|uniref:Cell division topological determinant MinJ n=1 Tax=Thermovenabulum gondwanense TaxID=520767 RepID=A0A161QBS2_9FIRM|nr:PDZ domain-containing protein [Thermovenabulum gondwanense]KYO66558.1 Cell division topological determinant MinJ [Thermovenabulum gondwanense]